jgi:signal transduction histidine kinase
MPEIRRISSGPPAPLPSGDGRPVSEPRELSGDTATPLVEELRSTIESLTRQVIALQRISTLGVLAGGVFHELNNALTPILNYAKLGLRNPDQAYRERALSQIVEASLRAAEITRGMLGLSRIGNREHREAVDLATLVDEVALLVRKDLARYRVRLDVKTIGRPHARVNPAQIQQVVMNLLINARQAMSNGGTVHLRLAPDSTGRLVELSVTDTGVGIAPKDLRRIFEPFYSTKSGPDASGQGGTGLGLAVCRDLVEAHRGRLRAESRLGQGSVFTVILPTCPGPSTAAPMVRDGAA